MRSRPNDSAFPWILGDWKGYEPEMREGFTKAELVTAAIAAGLAFRGGYSNWANLAIDACAIADAVLKERHRRDDARLTEMVMAAHEDAP